ncbi:MAG: hypothetical protein ACRD9W_21730, partial [Terriglobia bacterium]
MVAHRSEFMLLGTLSPVCLNGNLPWAEKLPKCPLSPNHPFGTRSLFHERGPTRSTVQQFA